MCLYMYNRGVACDIKGIHLEVLTQTGTLGADGVKLLVLVLYASLVCDTHAFGTYSKSTRMPTVTVEPIYMSLPLCGTFEDSV